VIPGAKFCAQCGYPLVRATTAPPAAPTPQPRNTMKIALWTAGILILVAIAGIGSCTYVVGQRVHQKFLQAKQAIEEAKPTANLDPCSLITQEELAEIYKRPFVEPVKEGTGCRYKTGVNAAGGVSVTVMPDFFLFLHATQQYQAHPHTLYGARGFFADKTLFLSYHAVFVKIVPLRGRVDAEEIAKLVLARL